MLYIRNQDYPSRIRPTDKSCSCSIETNSCSSQIKVYFIHFQLHDEGGICLGNMTIKIDDNEQVRRLTCSDSTMYDITQKMTISTNYITVTLENPDGKNDGYFWIGFEGNMEWSGGNVQYFIWIVFPTQRTLLLTL